MEEGPPVICLNTADMGLAVGVPWLDVLVEELVGEEKVEESCCACPWKWRDIDRPLTTRSPGFDEAFVLRAAEGNNILEPLVCLVSK